MDFLRISNDEQSQEKDDVSENDQIKLYSKEQLQSLTYNDLRDVARVLRDKTGDNRIKLNSQKLKLVGQVLDAQQFLKSQNNNEKENTDISDSRDPSQVDEDGLVIESSDEPQADLSIDRKSSTGPVLDEVQTILPAEEQVVLKRISVDVVVEPKQSSQSPVRRSSLEQVLFSSSHIDTNNTETQNDSTNSEEPFLFDMSNASDPLSVSALGGKTFIIEKKCAVESEVDNSNQRNIFDGNDLFATPKLNSQKLKLFQESVCKNQESISALDFSLPSNEIENYYEAFRNDSMFEKLPINTLTEEKPKTDETLEAVIFPGKPWNFTTPTIQQLMTTAQKLSMNVFQYSLMPQTVPDLRDCIPDQVQNIRGDGHCGYRSLSFCLTGTQEYHGLLRMAICRWIIGNVHFYPKFYEIYPKAFQQVKQFKINANVYSPVDANFYMDASDMQAAAIMLQINIAVHVKFNGKHNWSLYAANFPQTGQVDHEYDERFPTIIFHYTGNHFEAVKSVKYNP